MGDNASKSDGSRSAESQGSKSNCNVHVHAHLPESGLGGVNTNIHIDDEIKKPIPSSKPNKE